MDNYNRIVYTTPYDSEVEYLESTASASTYIDTGLKQSDIVSIETQFADILGYGGSYRYSIGSGTGSNDSNIIGFKVYNGNLTVNLKGSTTTVSSGHLNTFKTVSVNFVTGAVKINSAKQELTPCELTDDILYLFKIPTLRDQRYGFQPIMLKYFKAFGANNTLIRDMIPVRKGNVGYMYDKVSGKLFGNKGTGNFILGQDVANPVPNIRRVFFFDNKRYAMPRRLEEGFDYEKYEWIGTTLSTLEIHGGIITSDTMSSDLHSLVVRAYRPTVTSYSWDKFYYPVWNDEDTKTSFATRCNDSRTGNVYVLFKQRAKGNWNFVISFSNVSWKEVEFTWGSSNYIRSRGETSGGASTNQNGMNYTYYNDIRGLEMIFRLSNLSYSKIQLNRWYFKGANGIIDLYPCKLIRDIPSIFAKDNQIHYKGETGLYNAIDGKFWAIEDSFVTNE